MALSESDTAAMLGICKRALRRARLAGTVHPCRAGRGFLWTPDDVATFLATRPAGLNAKQAAAALGISRTQLARYRKSGRLPAMPAAGTTRVRYVYDPATLASFRG